MKIGILECGRTMPKVAARHGDFPDMFAQLLDGHGFTFESYNVEDMHFPESPDSCDGWLLTGSKHGAYEDHPFIPKLEAFIRDAFEEAVPMVGICFGHQIIATALGGHVEKFDGGWSLGLNAYEFEGLGEIKLNAWHQDQVLRIPDGARTIASSAFCQHAALLYDKRALTIQAHPEFGGEIIGQYVSLRRGTLDYGEDAMDHAAAHLSADDDNAKMAKRIAEFFLQERVPQHA
ncbi:MAG: type 1 glutamine amidotransferase [Pseudomonadota bacterium]